MSALPQPASQDRSLTVAAQSRAERELPDYLPARMVNEYVYCPRLFYYEWVEGLFRESADTVEGKFQHGRVDRGSGALPEKSDSEDRIHARSVTQALSGKGGILAANGNREGPHRERATG